MCIGLSGCSVFVRETQTSQQVLDVRTETRTEPQELAVFLEETGDDLVLTFARPRECREREVKETELVTTKDVPTWAVATDIVVGGALTWVGVNQFSSASEHSSEPLVDDEGNSPTLDAYVYGTLYTLTGVGVVGVGAWGGLREPQTDSVNSDTKIGPWLDVPCDNLPIAGSVATVAFGTSTLVDAKTDSQGRVLIPLKQLKEIYVGAVTAPDMMLEATIETADTEAKSMSVEVPFMVADDLQYARRESLYQRAMKQHGPSAALAYLRDYPSSDHRAEIVKHLTEQVLKKDSTEYYLKALEVASVDENVFQKVHPRLTKKLISADNLDLFERYVRILSKFEKTEEMAGMEVVELPYDDRVLKRYARLWADKAFDAYKRRFEEQGLDSFPSSPSGPSPFDTEAPAHLREQIKSFHLRAARTLKRKCLRNFDAAIADNSLERYRLAVKYAGSASDGQPIDREKERAQKAFLRKQRQSWSKRIRNITARCRQAKGVVNHFKAKVRRLKTSGQFDRLDKYISRSADRIQKATDEWGGAINESGQVLNEMRAQEVLRKRLYRTMMTFKKSCGR